MANIKKIRVNGTEYGVQPEWASVDGKTLAIAPEGNPAARIELGTSGGRGTVQIGGTGQSDNVYVGSSASNTNIYLEGASFSASTNYTEIGMGDGTVELLGTVLVNHSPIGGGGGDLPWAEYDSNTGALGLGTGFKTGSSLSEGVFINFGAPGISIGTKSISMGTNGTESITIGTGNTATDLRGTVTVNGSPIGGGVEWADYASVSNMLTIGTQCNSINIGTGTTGMNVNGPSFFYKDVQINNTNPYWLIWLGTHDGKIGVGDPWDGLSVRIGTDSIGVGVRAGADGESTCLAIGTDSIVMSGEGNLSLGTRTVALGSGTLTAGNLTIGTGKLTAGALTISSAGLELGTLINIGQSDEIFVRDSSGSGTEITSLGVNISGGDGLFRDDNGVALGTVWGCGVAVNSYNETISVGTKNVSTGWQPSLTLNGVSWAYDAAAGTVTLTAGGKSAVIQLTASENTAAETESGTEQ